MITIYEIWNFLVKNEILDMIKNIFILFISIYVEFFNFH